MLINKLIRVFVKFVSQFKAMKKCFLVLIFGGFVFLSYSQSLYEDMQFMVGHLKNNDCVQEKPFKKLKKEYDFHYQELYDLGIVLCQADQIQQGFISITETLSPLTFFYDQDEQGQEEAEIAAHSDRYITAYNQLDSFKQRIDFLEESEQIFIATEEVYSEYSTVAENMENFMKRYADSVTTSRGGIMQFLNLGNDKSVSTSGSAKAAMFGASPALIVDAAANFLVAKTKYELNAKFVEELRKIYTEKVEFQELMPAAHDIIMNADPMNFSTWNTLLQTSLQKDILNMPYNLPAFINGDNSFFKDIDPSSMEMVKVTLLVFQAYENTRRGMLPVSNFRRLEKDFGIDENPEFNLAKGITMVNTLIESFSTQDKLVPSNAIYEVANDTEQKAIFYYLYSKRYKEKLGKIRVSDSITMSESLSADWELKTDQLLSLAAKLNTALIQAGKTLEHLQDENLQKGAQRHELIAVNSVIPDFVDAVFMYLSIMDPLDTERDHRYKRLYKPLTADAINLTNGVLLENYNAALIATISIFVTSLTEINHNATEKEDDLARVVHNRERIKRMVHWGGFLADFLALDKSAEATDLFVKYSTVNASYRVKRNNKYSVSLNAYPGFYIGNEQAELRDNFKQYNTSSAVTAPIGLSFSQSFTRRSGPKDFDYYKQKSPTSEMKLFKYTGLVHGLFFPILDLGAPFAYRWANDQSAGFTEDLKWSQLFSPGAYYTFGLKGSGLTFAIGGQMTPELRANQEGVIETQESAWRFGATLTYDVPILTLWKSKISY